jgi:hypothetical protein
MRATLNFDWYWLPVIRRGSLFAAPKERSLREWLLDCIIAAAKVVIISGLPATEKQRSPPRLRVTFPVKNQ